MTSVRRHIVVLAVLLLVGCTTGSRPPRIGSQAPDFTVQDRDRTVRLSDYRDKIIVLNFWATWCPPCIEEMPSLMALQRQMKDKITVVAVSVDVDENLYKDFIRNHQIDMLTVRDEKQVANQLYGSYKFPETYVIDKQGVLRRKFIGPANWTSPEIIDYLNKL